MSIISLSQYTVENYTSYKIVQPQSIYRGKTILDYSKVLVQVL